MQLLGRKSTRFSVLSQYKAALMCLLILIAGAPDLHAQAPPAPYETNCQPLGGQPPTGFQVTVDDSDQNATINYTVYCNGAVYQTGSVYPGNSFDVYGCLGGLTGNMTATDTSGNYNPTVSSQGDLSF